MEVIIMMGLPGVGKTTWAKKNYPHAVHCSADHFFEKSGEYKFDPKQLGQANAECMRKFIEVLLVFGHYNKIFNLGAIPPPAHLTPPSAVIVDNTNCNVHSLSPYIGIACAFGLFPRIVMVRDPGDAFDRQLHKVPRFNWDAMRYQLNELLSKWPGIWPTLETVFSEKPSCD